MKPKKKILLIDANEERISVRRFLLETNGYRVFAAADAAEALAFAECARPEVAWIAWPFDGGERLLEKLRFISPFTTSLVFAEGASGCPDAIADMLLWGKPQSVELLDRVKVLASRRRGPKKYPPALVRDLQDVVESQNFGYAAKIFAGGGRIP